MQKWEYKMIDSYRLEESELNRLGDEGWELVIYSYDGSYFIFKRPKA
ncbi:MAG: hypothetical protein QOG00_1316 [Pyrinomonadaceae bacterium]|nr:hypothetical protein [Pyrinomonadaceae bacterium]